LSGRIDNEERGRVVNCRASMLEAGANLAAERLNCVAAPGKAQYVSIEMPQVSAQLLGCVTFRVD
jgi:hypothetical protein